METLFYGLKLGVGFIIGGGIAFVLGYIFLQFVIYGGIKLYFIIKDEFEK